MALIKCPECRKEISDSAPACIHCGCPSVSLENSKIKKAQYDMRCIKCGARYFGEICPTCGYSAVKSKGTRKIIVSILLLFAFLCICVIISISRTNPNSQQVNSNTPNQTTPTLMPSPIKSTEMPTEEIAVDAEGEGDIGKYHVKIKNIEMTKDYSNENAVLITYEWTNNDDKAKAFWPGLDATVFQDGIECKTPFVKVDGVGSDGKMTEIQSGKTYEFRIGYTLNSDFPEIEVEIKESFSLSKNPTVISKKFELTFDK